MSTIYSNRTPSTNSSDAARIKFVIDSALSGLRTAIPCMVKSVTNSGGVAPIGYVSVQPLVNSLDGNGNSLPHGIIYNVPYLRLQGGSNAVIIDPQVGDIGIGTVCDRDISNVKTNQAAAAPASLRKNDMSDMVYLMTIIGATPTQYIQFNTSGITITSPNTLTINASNVVINGNIQATGTLTSNGHDVSSTHKHSGVTVGGGNTGSPL